MAVSKETQLTRLTKKFTSLIDDSYTGTIELRFEHGNIIHTSTNYQPTGGEIMELITKLADKNHYGKLCVHMKEGKIIQLEQTDNKKIHLDEGG